MGRRETLAIVGESGSGTATTGRAIVQLTRPTSGDIRLKGRSIRDLPAAEMQRVRRDVQMIFQDPFAALNPRMTIEQIIAEPLQIHADLGRSETRERVVSLLKRVELDGGYLRRYPFELSGGQRQRICITRAIALNPSVLIADEAVSALDVSTRAQIINLLMDLQDEFGLSIAFISHDLAVVERMSHPVAVMYIGRIVEMGPRGAVISAQRHAYTRRLIESVPSGEPRHLPRSDAVSQELPSTVKPLDYAVGTPTVVHVAADHWVLAEQPAG